MSKYKGRDRAAHEAWIRDNADYFTVFIWQTRQKAETRTLDEAIQLAAQTLSGSEKSNPAMIYAIKEIHSTLVGTYDPLKGFKSVLG